MRAFCNRNHIEENIGCWILVANYVHDYCKSCDACQRFGGLAIQSLTKLITSLPEEPFIKWGLDFVGLIKPT